MRLEPIEKPQGWMQRIVYWMSRTRKRGYCQLEAAPGRLARCNAAPSEIGIGTLVESGGGFAGEDVPPTVAIEIQPKSIERLGLSLFAEDRLDDSVVLGLRHYWGERKELRRRHLEDATLRFKP